MKKIITIYLLALSLISLGHAATPVEDLDDFTETFHLRSLFSGDILKVDDNEVNWKLREITLPDKLKDKDPIGKKMPYGIVQFVSPKNDDVCLGIDESGFFRPKPCKKDIEDGTFETLFSIMPTSSSAVQIRSLVLNGDECIMVFDNPQLPRGRDFGIKKCFFNPLTLIDTRFLLVIAPPLRDAKILSK